MSEDPFTIVLTIPPDLMAALRTDEDPYYHVRQWIQDKADGTFYVVKVYRGDPSDEIKNDPSWKEEPS